MVWKNVKLVPPQKTPSRISPSQIILHFDGGAKPNPGKMRCCVAVTNVLPMDYIFRQLGYGSNNTAEWHGLLLAMQTAITRHYADVVIYGDSMLIVNQANGRWRINNLEHRKLFTEFQELRRRLKSFALHQLPRDTNQAGIYLETH